MNFAENLSDKLAGTIWADPRADLLRRHCWRRLVIHDHLAVSSPAKIRSPSGHHLFDAVHHGTSCTVVAGAISGQRKWRFDHR